jgi:hypothetical protein
LTRPVLAEKSGKEGIDDERGSVGNLIDWVK